MGCSIQTAVREAAASSEYILCLDDDIILHPGLLQELIAKLECDSSWFMATGTVFSFVLCVDRNPRSEQLNQTSTVYVFLYSIRIYNTIILYEDYYLIFLGFSFLLSSCCETRERQAQMYC